MALGYTNEFKDRFLSKNNNPTTAQRLITYVITVLCCHSCTQLRINSGFLLVRFDRDECKLLGPQGKLIQIANH